MSIRIRRSASVAIALFALSWSTPASAQKVTTLEELTLRQTLISLVGPVSAPVGEGLALATQIEAATAPFGTSSGGFVFKLDPSTGLLVRSATTFGPSFADRALTSGEGQVSIGASFASFNLNRLGDMELGEDATIKLNSIRGSSTVNQNGSLDLSSKVLVMSAAVGVTENLDINVAVPIVSIRFRGVATTINGSNVVSRAAVGQGTFSGVGDIAASVKYRFMKFGDELPDPGGVAALIAMHLPTGDKENLRGLGVTRTGVTLIASGRMGVIQPHGNFGYEWWSDGLEVPTNFSGSTVTVRNQLSYAAGIEVEAAPKLTLLADLIGRQIKGGGELGYVSASGPGGTTTESLVALPDGISKLTFVPGLKVNLKAKMLLSLNVLISMKDNGLHSRITPVAGISLTP